ncbi:response regulator [Carboxydothermus hydrogenoformans]|uniref:Stage 0 sporulation protein A homolog n=1 Tax=Carboxydothermus hydrogenoformans (strain ATCC BAA-161 / DSM 6008 / Z-2901) TaxID=246194 RepID=Q3AFT6_CARHZ|nr:response regulator [Carboxydothermus hydrogenoformans]ABB15952.1 response regulator [Carboxydothermus hydrogenoformans Z-2901]
MTKPSILIVDDQPGIIKLLKDALELRGYVVYTAGNTGTAKALVLEKKPLLLILDVNLGGENSFVLARQIKDILPEGKIIFITAYQEEEILRQIRELGGEVLVKPFSLEELYRKVQAVVSSDGRWEILSNCDTRNF